MQSSSRNDGSTSVLNILPSLGFAVIGDSMDSTDLVQTEAAISLAILIAVVIYITYCLSSAVFCCEELYLY